MACFLKSQRFFTTSTIASPVLFNQQPSHTQYKPYTVKNKGKPKELTRTITLQKRSNNKSYVDEKRE